MTDWDDFRYFLAVARNGSVTSASTVLEVNHSTVSRRIAAMEKKHGVRLFERLISGYEMTPAAENIYQLALDIEAKNHEMQRLLFAQDSRLQGTINITIPHDLANYCVLPYFKAFTDQHPDISINFIVSPGLKDLNAREADIAVRLTPVPPDNLVGKKLARLRHGIYQSKLYKVEANKPVDLILWKHETTPPKWVKDHFPDHRVVLRVDDMASKYAAVKAGYGLARIPCYLPDTLNDKNIRRLSLDMVPSDWGLWVLSHADLRQTARIKACKEFLHQILQEQTDLIEGKLSSYL